MNWYKKSQSDEDDDLNESVKEYVGEVENLGLSFEDWPGHDKQDTLKKIMAISEMSGVTMSQLVNLGTWPLRCLIILLDKGLINNQNDYTKAIIMYMKVKQDCERHSESGFCEATMDEIVDEMIKRWNNKK